MKDFKTICEDLREGYVNLSDDHDVCCLFIGHDRESKQSCYFRSKNRKILVNLLFSMMIEDDDLYHVLKDSVSTIDQLKEFADRPEAKLFIEHMNTLYESIKHKHNKRRKKG